MTEGVFPAPRWVLNEEIHLHCSSTQAEGKNESKSPRHPQAQAGSLDAYRARLLSMRVGAAKAGSRKELEEIEVALNQFACEVEKKHLLEPLSNDINLLKQSIFHRIIEKSASPAAF